MDFTIFKEMLDYMAHISKVTDATMYNYCGEIDITGETEGQTIRIRVSITDKEEVKNAEELE